jgi:transposase
MNQDNRAGATPRQYDEAFKREAVRLWKSSGRSATITARELGISVYNIYEWGRGFRDKPPPGAGAPPATVAELQAENLRLRREVARLTEQREVLKKAAGILSEPPHSGMP